MGWIPIEEINDNDKFYSGTAFRFFETQAGLDAGHSFPIRCGSMDYIMVPLKGETEYMSLICLSVGEEGNAYCCLKISFDEKGNAVVTGKEVKRMLLSDIEKVLVNPNPRYIVDDLPFIEECAEERTP